MLAAAGRVTLRSFEVLGVQVHAVQIPDVVEQMCRWIDAGEAGRFIAVTGMHGVTEARHDSRLRQALATADLVVPDGMPLVWVGRARGEALRRRVYGPELMLEFCRVTARRGYRHFFYGGAPGVAGRLGEVLARAYPGVEVAGTFAPPFRALQPREKLEVRRRINKAAADVLWVGLGTPKQETWMLEHHAHLRVPVLVGVGAAFDLNTGRVRQAPVWIREHGLEWLFRLAQEPRRLWKRYLIRGPEFVWNVSMELVRPRRPD